MQLNIEQGKYFQNHLLLSHPITFYFQQFHDHYTNEIKETFIIKNKT